MVDILIRMKLTVLRRSMSGQRASEFISGISLGLLAATGTIWLGTLSYRNESVAVDVLAAVFSLWLLGWIIGSIFFGGGDQTLQPEYFTLLPISSRRLAMGLFSVAFVGVGALVTLVAVSCLVVYGARLGVGPLIVAVPAALLQLAIIILLSRLIIEVLNDVMRFQVVWSTLLVRRTTTKKTARPSKLGLAVVFRHRLLSTTEVGAVISKELRNWLRDPMRMYSLYFAFFYALLFCLLPLALGTLILLPWTAAIFIVMAAMNTNFYGSDGSALWLTLLTPGAEGSDVLGRQGVWLLMVAPMALVFPIVLTTMSGQSWAWPWVLATTPALLGGAAGLTLLISVFYPVPRAEPHLRNNNTLQGGSDIGQAILLLVLVPITAVPALAVVIAGAMNNNALLQWSGISVGIFSGAFFTWWLGRIAYQRLEARGPELLQLMRSGSNSHGSDGASGFLSGLSTGKRQVVILCLSFCWIPLVPQGIVPMIMILSGKKVPSWFLALYLPEPYQWPTIFAMLALGSCLLGAGLFIIQRGKKEQQQRKSAL